MPPQTLQEQEDAIVKRFGGTPVTTSTPTVSPEEADIVKRFGGVPKPRTYAETLLERERARLDKLEAPPLPPDTYQGPHIGPAPSFLESLQTRFQEGLKGLAESTAMMLAQGPTVGGAQMAAAEAERLREVYTRPDRRYDVGFGPRESSMLEHIPIVGGILGPPANRLRQGDVGGAAGDILSQFAVPEALNLVGPNVVAKVKTEAAANRPVMAAEAAERARLARTGKEASYAKLFQQAFPEGRGAEYTAADVQTTIPHMAGEHAISPIASPAETAAAKTRAIGNIETNVQRLVDHFPNEMVQVPLQDIEAALDTGAPGPRTPGSRAMGTRSTDVAKGMKAIETLGLDQPMPLSELYDRVLRMNKELEKELNLSKSDVANLRGSDPEFRAVELAVDHARNLVYDRLDQLGVPGVRDLRAAEAALIKTRAAVNRQRFAGETMVKPSGAPHVGPSIVDRLVKMGMTGAAGWAGGPLGGVVGGELGEAAVNAMRGRATRNIVVERAMRNLEGIQGPTFPQLPPPPPGGPGGPGGAVGFPRWTPPGQGPLPTVTVLPEGPAGLTSGTPPLALPPAPPELERSTPTPDQQGSMFGDEAPPEPPKPSTPTPLPTPTPAPDAGARSIAANVSEVDPRSIKVDPERFQFKSNFDPSGVVPESRIKGAWNDNLAGMLLTWVDPVDGQRYVINGHNRLAAAVSKNVPRIIIRDVQAADAAEARAYGAMANIAENNGSPVDAAKVLRHATDPAGKLKELGIDTTRRLARDGLALAQLSDPLFQRVATGDLNEALGIAIGRAELSPENQMAVVQLVERQAKKGKKLTPEVVAHLIEDVQDAPTVEHASQQGNMFADLLGEDRSQSVAIERAQIRDWLQTTLEKDKRLFKYVQQGDRAARLAAEGNVINKEANVAKAQQSATIAELVKKLANAKGPINDALTTAAVNTAAGQDTGAIRAKLLEQVKRAIEFELGGGTGAQ